MVIANYFITPKFVFKYFDKKGANKWLFAIIGGIFIRGPNLCMVSSVGRFKGERVWLWLCCLFFI